MRSLSAVCHVVWFFLCKLLRVRGYGISILVPARIADQDVERRRSWDWLQKYWRSALPGAEIVIGSDPDAGEVPFSKSVAVNDAASRAHGEVLVIVDADVYIAAEAVLESAAEIRLAERRCRNLWFMPYRHLYRLTKEASERFLRSDPSTPPVVPVTEMEITNIGKFDGTPFSEIGHWYGAMIQIMSRKAFRTVGGWDQRFRGWGGEDHAAMVAMDTLYGPHKTLPGEILHLWHRVIVPDSTHDPKGKKRLWLGQEDSQNNDTLSGRYYYSNGNPHRMRKLVNESRNAGGKIAATPRPKPTVPNVSS
jgi:Glycosyltransferase like family 2